MSDELKPCPFCKSVDVCIEVDGNFALGKCNNCGATSAIFRLDTSFDPLQRIAGARMKWNERPIEDELRKRAEAAKSDLRSNEIIRDRVEELEAQRTNDNKLIEALYSAVSTLMKSHRRIISLRRSRR